jgi:hypothetical protein
LGSGSRLGSAACHDCSDACRDSSSLSLGDGGIRSSSGLCSSGL